MNPPSGWHCSFHEIIRPGKMSPVFATGLPDL
jgi:hypothetical protein